MQRCSGSQLLAIDPSGSCVLRHEYNRLAQEAVIFQPWAGCVGIHAIKLMSFPQLIVIHCVSCVAEPYRGVFEGVGPFLPVDTSKTNNLIERVKGLPAG